MNNIKIARLILETSNSACDCSNEDYTFSELKQLMQEILDNIENDDFYIENLACGEVRVISKGAIGELWHDGLIEQIKDCYDLNIIDELPSFIACEIDWDQTAENCKVDGMGHYFAGYDHEEHSTGTHYIFRIN